MKTINWCSSVLVISLFLSQWLLGITCPSYHLKHNKVGCTAAGRFHNGCIKTFVCHGVRGRTGWMDGLPDTGKLVGPVFHHANGMYFTPLGRCLCPNATPCYVPYDVLKEDDGTGYCSVTCAVVPPPLTTTMAPPVWENLPVGGTALFQPMAVLVLTIPLLFIFM